MDKNIRKAVATVVEAILHEEAGKRPAHRAAVILSDKLVVTATRRVFGGKIDRRNKNVEVVLTIGRPNYLNRQRINAAKRDGVKISPKTVWFQRLK